MEEQQPTKDPASPETREDFSIDFGRIKSWFKSAASSSAQAKQSAGQSSTQSPEPASQDSIAVDWRRIVNFAWHYRIFLILLIPLIIGAMVRLESQTLPAMDRAAVANVENFVLDDLRNAVSAQYPNLPSSQRDRIVNEEMSKARSSGTYQFRVGQYRGQSINLADEAKKVAAGLKAQFQYEENGKIYTYMPDIDPYTYLRWTRNLVEKGSMGDEVRNGKQWDTHMRAPKGDEVDQTAHPYVLNWIYRFMKIFNSKIPLMQAVSYFPVIFAVLAGIPAFFLARRVGGNAAGFFAALLVVLNPSFLGRTTWGHADTDAYNIFFPLLIAWLFIEGFEHASRKWQLGLTALAGISTGLFSVLWSGWWYIFDFILAVIGIVFVYTVFAHRSVIKREGIASLTKHPAIVGSVLVAIVYVLTSGIAVSLGVGFTGFIQAPLAPFDFMNIKSAAAGASLWPNVLTTVAELNEVDYRQVIEATGGKLIFVIAAFGVLLTLLRKDEHGKRDVKYASFLIIWFLATMYASTKGIRFMMLVAPAISVAFGIAVGASARYFGPWLKRELRIPQWLMQGVVVVIAGIIVMPVVNAAYETPARDLPLINDGWTETLYKIRDNSKQDAIITSWWDFGHHFKYYADRPVTFDGATQNEPMAHWVGKILLTDDEELAAGLLRMLDCGSDRAFVALDSVINDTSKSVKLLYTLAVLDKETARDVLTGRYGLTDSQADSVLAETHCDPPEAFFIASQDMIGKSGVWGHFGSWDFDRADVWVQARKLPREQGIASIMAGSGASRELATQLYDEAKALRSESDANSWIAPWPSYASGLLSCSPEGNTTINCENQALIDLRTMDVKVGSNSGPVHPVGIVFPNQNGTQFLKFKDAKLDLAVVFVPLPEGPRVIFARPEIANSMFTRMFFYGGHGLRYFKPFHRVRDVGGNWINTYELDWTGVERNIVYQLNVRNETKKEEPKQNNTTPQANSSSAANSSEMVNSS